MTNTYSKTVKRFSFLLLAFIIAVIPHLVYLVEIMYSSTQIYLFGGDSSYDLYNTVKFYFFVFAIVLLIFCLIVYYFLNGKNDKFDFKIYVLFFQLFALLVVLFISYYDSQYRDIALIGDINHYNGVVSHLGYLILVISIIFFVKTEKQFKLLNQSLVFSSVALSIIGIMQIYNINIYTDSVISFIIFRGADATFFRPVLLLQSCASFISSNYFGVFLVPALIISIDSFLKKEKSWFDIIVPITIYVGMLSSNSEAAALAFWLALPLVYYRNMEVHKSILKRYNVFLITVCIASIYAYFARDLAIITHGAFLIVSVLLTIIMVYVKSLISIKKILSQIAVATIIYLLIVLLPVVSVFILPKSNRSLRLEQLQLNDKTITIKNKSMIVPLQITFDGSDFSINESEKTKILLNNKTGEIHLKREDGNFSIISLAREDETGRYRIIKLMPWQIFLRQEKNRLYYTGHSGRQKFSQQHIESVPVNVFFNSKPYLFNARTYIWSRALPLLNNRFFFGYGADTFLYIFPQYEYFAKCNYSKSGNMLISSPHNLFLSWILDFGLVGFLVISGILITALKSTIFDNCSVWGAVLIALLIAGDFTDATLQSNILLFVAIAITMIDYGGSTALVNR